MSLIPSNHLTLYRLHWFCDPILTVHRISPEKAMAPTPVLLPGKPHGRRSLEGCSPWGRWGSDTTERLHFHFSLSCIGEGNGTPLQYSCLENPRDGGAWWAAVCGVAQSRTRLKWLSSRISPPLYKSGTPNSALSITELTLPHLLLNLLWFLYSETLQFSPLLFHSTNSCSYFSPSWEAIYSRRPFLALYIKLGSTFGYL